VKQAGLMGLIALAAAACALTATVHAAPGRGSHRVAAPNPARCGGNLWRLKTFSDRDRGTVNTTPKSTTIAAILQRPAPSRIPTRRSTSFQRQLWQIPAQITRYWRDGNELRLELYDHNAYMNAVVPAPFCLPTTARARSSISATWQMFMKDCGRATKTMQSLGAVMTVTGVGYWSQNRGQHGQAPNGAELHPVTSLRPVSGCGN
jgi:hypothetical protein